jgi:AcrR family transcriptional regulator
MVDHVIDQTRRPSRAQQRAATRLAILDATGECLVADGYANATTRRIAERAGVAQSTLMHHFPTREQLRADAVTHLATQLAEEALEELDLSQLRRAAGREAVLDKAWRKFTSPAALASAQLWAAAWAEPELAATLRELEQRLSAINLATAGALFPAEASDDRFPVLLDTAVSLIRGLIMAIPVAGRAVVDARWESMKPLLLNAAADLFD